MDHVKEKMISLAGYVFIKFGYNLEWQKSWILLENRTLYFTDKVIIFSMYPHYKKNLERKKFVIA